MYLRGNGRGSKKFASPKRRGTSLKLVKAAKPKSVDALVVASEREGLQRTPQRVATALRFLTSGYRADIRKIVNEALYTVKYDEMVIVKDIEFFSLCEHHLLPFFGKM